MSGRSKGFGFVEFETEDEASKAIEMFNGKDFEGRRITVSEARPMESRPRRDLIATTISTTNDNLSLKALPFWESFCLQIINFSNKNYG